MGSYYYLVAQLPSLVYGQAAPMTVVAFRDLAKSFLDSNDGVLLDAVSLDPGATEQAEEGKPSYAEAAPASGCEFIDRWRDWERTLRLTVARVRAQRTKREGGAPVEPPLYPVDATAVAVSVMAEAESPLEAEIALDKARWNAIGYLQGLNTFDRNVVYAYLLKLLILERYSMFKTEEGFKEYKSLYAAILQGVQPGVPPVGEPK